MQAGELHVGVPEQGRNGRKKLTPSIPLEATRSFEFLQPPWGHSSKYSSSSIM